MKCTKLTPEELKAIALMSLLRRILYDPGLSEKKK
jgi:hypothetical protein